MAAMTQAPSLVVRAARASEGAMIARLWRELWDAHENWGGYLGSRDPAVYARLAERLDDDARVRGGHPLIGRHVHLVSEFEGHICGQVEGWLDHHGADRSTPMSCDVRSLIVSADARRAGVGRALLLALASVARTTAQRLPCVMAAEVLEPNPARGFYERLGYVPVSWNARMTALSGLRNAGGLTARLATPADALSIARLETNLATRRRDAGDNRFDRPRAIDATFVDAIASHLSHGAQDPATLVATDSTGAVRGVASFTVHALDPPFVPVRRALVGRFSLDPAGPPLPILGALVALGCRMAVTDGAEHVELTDLSAPKTDLYGCALALGACPWSRVVTKSA